MSGRSAAGAAIFLAGFKLAAYARSHRLFQPLIGLIVMLGIFYAVAVPAGAETSSYADSAGLLIVVFAWAARGLLDTEPAEQRLVSMTAAGSAGREVIAGLVAAAAVNAGLAAVAVGTPLLYGFAVTPGPAVILQGAALHALGALVGTALGALTSRPVFPSPATSMLALFGGYVGLLLLSATPAGRVLVPVLGWMRAAGDGTLTASFAAFAVPTVLWSAAALTAYALLRRTRP
ncbi:hypothetical protein HNP84_008039 [Thermocatellispora tengchongensis]|uniref:Uncharacterized protein n=1 Tax=Thermocatellispora tengchongensis TaxID=1073253 RepID=A0A840PHH0_9ACTN|nr:hypothetical protein [Thermocatellispora tengchongensis]MBB5138286.1 hypothetical protein [Thermocatellispora tengchongensis]